MCLAQGPQRSDACEAWTHGPSVSSQALYYWATVLHEDCILEIQRFKTQIQITDDYCCKELWTRIWSSLQQHNQYNISWGCSFNSFLANCDFCHLLITLANSLDPDQDRQNVGPDLDPNCLTLWWYSWKNFRKKLILERNPQRMRKSWKITQHAKS